MRNVLILVATLGLSPSTSACAEPMTAMGLGAKSCANFAQSYKKNPEVAESMYFSWAQGFMSGHNVSFLITKEAETRNLAGTTVEEQQALIRSYCDNHPLAGFWEAVMSVYVTLPTAPPKK